MAVSSRSVKRLRIQQMAVNGSHGQVLPLSKLSTSVFFSLFQALSLTMDVKNVSQYTIFVHQHNKIYPECAEPYGLHSIKVVPHREPGIMETRGFLIKDTLMKGLPHDGLPCHINKEDEVLGYDGGIGECIDSMFIELILS